MCSGLNSSFNDTDTDSWKQSRWLGFLNLPERGCVCVCECGKRKKITRQVRRRVDERAENFYEKRDDDCGGRTAESGTSVSGVLLRSKRQWPPTTVAVRIRV